MRHVEVTRIEKDAEKTGRKEEGTGTNPGVVVLLTGMSRNEPGI